MLTDEQRAFWARQIEQAHEYIDDLGHEPRTSWQLRQATYLAVDARLTALERVAECAQRWRMSAPSEVRAALAALDAPEPRP